jgi:hypothetical protein
VYEQPSSPGHRVGPALIALLVALAATAGTFGYLVARRVVDAQASGGTSPTTPPAGGSSQSPGGNQPTRTQPAGTGTPNEPDPAAACPEVTVKAVRDAGLNADLTVLLYVQARRQGADDAEVWICKNADDRLIYQGHLLRGPITAAESDDSILLAEGIKGTVETEGTGYKATNVVGDRSTEYHVSRDALVLRHLPGGRTEEYRITVAKP